MALRSRSAISCLRGTAAPKSTMGPPVKATVPPSGISSPFRQRSTVVLPEPDGPISTSTWPWSTARSMDLSTWLLPKDLRRPVTVSTRPPEGDVPCPSSLLRGLGSVGIPAQPPFQIGLSAGQGQAEDPVHQGSFQVQQHEFLAERSDLLRLPEQLGDQDQRRQRGVLDQRDKRIGQRRYGHPGGLRQDDALQGLPVGHADRVAGFPLALRYRKD